MKYTTDLKFLDEINMNGFFVGWPNPPSKEIFKNILKGSYKIVLCHDDKRLLGFINSISDGVLSSYIPLLEVLPEFQGRGIGKELISRLKKELSHLYMIDVLCDKEIVSYYESQGMSRSQGAVIRNYGRQSGD